MHKIGWLLKVVICIIMHGMVSPLLAYAQDSVVLNDKQNIVVNFDNPKLISDSNYVFVNRNRELVIGNYHNGEIYKIIDLYNIINFVKYKNYGNLKNRKFFNVINFNKAQNTVMEISNLQLDDNIAHVFIYINIPYITPVGQVEMQKIAEVLQVNLHTGKLIKYLWPRQNDFDNNDPCLSQGSFYYQGNYFFTNLSFYDSTYFKPIYSYVSNKLQFSKQCLIEKNLNIKKPMPVHVATFPYNNKIFLSKQSSILEYPSLIKVIDIEPYFSDIAYIINFAMYDKQRIAIKFCTKERESKYACHIALFEEGRLVSHKEVSFYPTLLLNDRFIEIHDNKTNFSLHSYSY